MSELLDQIKKLSREDQLKLADEIYTWEDEVVLSESERELLIKRAQEAHRKVSPVVLLMKF